MSSTTDAPSEEGRRALLTAVDEFKRTDGAGLSDADRQLLERFYREENAELVSIVGQFVEKHRKYPDDDRRFISSILGARQYASEAPELKAPTPQHVIFAECVITSMLAIFEKKDSCVVAALTEIVCDLQDLVLASQALLESLKRAYRETDQAKRPVHDPQIASWLRHSIALRGICDFLANIGAGQDIVDHVASISEAFCNLTKGLHPPLFTPNSPGGGRKNDPFDVWAARAAVVIGLRSFVASGTTDETKAAHLIAEIVDCDENYRPLLRLVRSGSAFESSILNWLKLLEDDSSGPGEGVLVYRRLVEDWKLKILSADGEPTKEQYRDWALGYLRQAASYARVVQTNRDGKEPEIYKRARGNENQS